MTAGLDLTLPATARAAAQFRDVDDVFRAIALYSLVELSDEELEELRGVCESLSYANSAGDNVRLPPRRRFVGQPLRAILEYHLEMTLAGTFSGFCFIVATDKDWRNRGVLFVNLSPDASEYHADSLQLKAEYSGSAYANFAVSNMGWDEYKDWEDAHPEKIDVEEESDPKYFVGVYVVDGLDADDILDTIMLPLQLRNPSEVRCQLQGMIEPTHDPIQQAIALHRKRCGETPKLNRSMIFVADTQDPLENGLALCMLDANFENNNDEASGFKVVRVLYSAFEAIQNGFIDFANGHRVWDSDYPLFVVFCYSSKGQNPAAPLQTLDKEWNKRKHGEERVFIAQKCFVPEEIKIIDDLDGEWIKYTFEEAVKWFPYICRLQRFTTNFSRDYFICIDTVQEEMAKLVKLDWDGNVRRTKNELCTLDLSKHISTRSVRTEDAYNTLESIVSGELAWQNLPKDA